MKPDAEILWGVVANARRAWEARSFMRRPLWGCVMEATGMGGTSAKELCRRFGFDPDSTGAHGVTYYRFLSPHTQF